MAKHEYRGSTNSRNQRTRSKLRPAARGEFMGFLAHNARGVSRARRHEEGLNENSGR